MTKDFRTHSSLSAIFVLLLFSFHNNFLLPSWEFKTEEHDIGFGVYYKSPDDVRKHIHTSDLEEVVRYMSS